MFISMFSEIPQNNDIFLQEETFYEPYNTLLF